MAGIMSLVGVSSLAGIPPFSGFIAKLMLFNVAFQTKLYFSLTAMVIGVVILSTIILVGSELFVLNLDLGLMTRKYPRSVD